MAAVVPEYCSTGYRASPDTCTVDVVDINYLQIDIYLSTWTRSDTRSRGSSCHRNLRRLRSGSCLNLDTRSTTLGTRAVSEVRVTALALHSGWGKYFQFP